MDIRSPQARHIQKGFDDGKMQNLAYGLRDTRSAQVYCRTTSDRFVRHDEVLNQFNVLAADRCKFVLVDSLADGETVDPTRKLAQMELLPPRTNWEHFKDGAVPNMGLLVFNIAIGAAVGTMVSSIVQHTGNPLRFILNHLPWHRHLAPAPHVNVAPAHAAARIPSMRYLSAADDFPDFDPWENDRWNTLFELESQQAQRDRAARDTWCQQNPGSCPDASDRTAGLVDYVVTAAGVAAFAGVGSIIVNGRMNRQPLGPMRAAADAPTQRCATVEEEARDSV